jgi:hypothetical protein
VGTGLSPRPIETRKPKSRDRIEIVVPKGPHPAVVLYAEDPNATQTGMLILAVGTSQNYGDGLIELIDRDPPFREMRLKEPTYFFKGFIHPVAWNGRSFTVFGRCEGGVFGRLQTAMREVLAEVKAGTRTISTIPLNDSATLERAKMQAAPTIAPPALSSAPGDEPK